MTTPTITYGHGFLTDCNSSTGWNKTEVGMESTLTVENDDIFVISGICNSPNNEYAYYEKDITDISSSVYTKFYVRWKTSVASNGAGLLVTLFFTDASQQDIVGTQATQVFSTSWTITSGTITPNKTIDKLRIYIGDTPDTISSGTYYVYVDFILLCKNVFTFPNTMHGLEFTPPTRYANIEIPSRVTDVTQNLGSRSATVRVGCNLDRARLDTTSSTCTGDDWKRPQGVDTEYQTDHEKGEVFLDIAHNSYAEPFQWLNTGKYRFKVTLEEPVFREQSNEHTLDLLFREYSRSNKNNESYVERFGICPVAQHWDADAGKCVDDA